MGKQIEKDDMEKYYPGNTPMKICQSFAEEVMENPLLQEYPGIIQIESYSKRDDDRRELLNLI